MTPDPSPRRRRFFARPLAAAIPLLGVLACASAEHELLLLPDADGADDVPDQSDISQLGFSDAHAADADGYFDVRWSFDDTVYPGGNSGDGCLLLDSDDLGGYSDFAICASFRTDTALQQVVLSEVTLFDCKNSEPDTDEGKRCQFNGGGGDGSNGVIGADGDGDGRIDGGDSFCQLSTQTADPFAALGAHGSAQDPAFDTGIACRLYVDELVELDGDRPGGLTPSNVCSFTSPDPGSTPKDCVTEAGAGFLSLTAVVDVADDTRFEFTLDGVSIAEISGGGDAAVPVSGDQTYTLAAAVPNDWTLVASGCSNGDDPAALTILSAEVVACTFEFASDPGADNTPNTGPTTELHSRVLFGFEDLKNDAANLNDFDYNDFVMAVDMTETINADGTWRRIALELEALARGASFRHELFADIGIQGAADLSIEYLDAAGNLLGADQFSNNALIISGVRLFAGDSWDVLPEWPQHGGSLSNTRFQQTAAERIPGRRTRITIDVNVPSSNPRVADNAATAHLNETVNHLLGPYLSVLDTGKRIQRRWRVDGGTTDLVTGDRYGADTPLLGFPLEQSLEFPGDWRWPVERVAIWQAYPRFVDFARSGDTTDTDWYVDSPGGTWPVFGAPTLAASAAGAAPAGGLPDGSFRFAHRFGSPVTAAPAVADLDGDGTLEVVVGEFLNRILVFDAAGRLLRTVEPDASGAQDSAASVTLADLDGDGDLEIIRGDDSGALYAFAHDGALQRQWQVAGTIKSTAAVADVDLDGRAELFVLGGDGKLYGFAARGGVLPGFPLTVGGEADVANNFVLLPTPNLVDLDGDDELEIVVVNNAGEVRAVGHDGRVRWTSAVGAAVLATAAVADLDGNGVLEIVVADLNGGVTLVSASGQTYWRRSVRTLGGPSSPALGDIDGDGRLDIAVGSNDGQLYAMDFNGRLLPGWPVATNSAIKSSPLVADVDGDGRAEVFVGSFDTGVYGYDGRGRALRTSAGGVLPVRLGAAILSSAIIADLDGDGDPSLVVGSYDHHLYAIEIAGDGGGPLPWPQFRGDARQLGIVGDAAPVRNRVFSGDFE